MKAADRIQFDYIEIETRYIEASLIYLCVCVCVWFGVVAVPNAINEDRLCHDQSLQRDEWPWIGKTSVDRSTRRRTVAGISVSTTH